MKLFVQGIDHLLFMLIAYLLRRAGIKAHQQLSTRGDTLFGERPTGWIADNQGNVEAMTDKRFFQQLGLVITSDNRKVVDCGAQLCQIYCRISRPSRHCLDIPDIHDGNRRLPADTICRSVEIHIEHRVTDYQYVQTAKAIDSGKITAVHAASFYLEWVAL